ncbi:unnamed protein product [Amoebophrya sp. A25]|nr:unnamed protein product [Amoebophrya sp. A25]|eukprot:GSA25T00024742001.1
MLLKARTTSLFGVPAGNMLLLLRLLLLGALPTALADVASVVDCTNAGVVGDAGSTGTRIYVVYNMTSDAGSPVIETIGKQQGGLAKVGAQAAFAGGLAELLREAYARLKALGCTAGKQRSLEEMSALMSSSQDSLQPNNHNRNISSSSSSSTIAALGEAGLLPPSMFEVGAGAELEDGEPFDYPVLPLGSLAEFSGHQNTAKPVSGGAVMGFLAVFGDMYEWLSQMMNSMSHWTPSGGGGKSSGKGGKNASGLREDAGSSGGFSASAAAEGKVGEVSSSSSNSKEHDSNSPANVNAAEEEGGDDLMMTKVERTSHQKKIKRTTRPQQIRTKRTTPRTRTRRHQNQRQKTSRPAMIQLRTQDVVYQHLPAPDQHL